MKYQINDFQLMKKENNLVMFMKFVNYDLSYLIMFRRNNRINYYSDSVYVFIKQSNKQIFKKRTSRFNITFKNNVNILSTLFSF